MRARRLMPGVVWLVVSDGCANMAGSKRRTERGAFRGQRAARFPMRPLTTLVRYLRASTMSNDLDRVEVPGERSAMAALHELQHDSTPNAAKPKLGGHIFGWAVEEIRALRALSQTTQDDAR